MQPVKNQIISLAIESLSSDGSGVGHFEGMAVFVPLTAVGDQLDVRLVRICKSYAFGIIEKIRSPGPGRIENDCACFSRCGGCDFRHLSYGCELAAKEGFVRDAMRRLGGITAPVLPILPAPSPERYRNKVQYPLTRDAAGHIVTGFFSSRSHRVVPCADCLLQPVYLNDIAQKICRLLEKYNISLYDETTGKGLVRHLYLRDAIHGREIMVCLVCNGRDLPHRRPFIDELTAQCPRVTTVVLNVNEKATNVITGEENITLYGSGVIHDTLCGVPVELDPLAFYQVNTLGAEQLYGVVAQFAGLCESDTVLDLYCGAGTIGLSLAGRCRALVGVEIVPQAVENARANAAKMGLENTRFLCADAGTAAAQLAAEGLKPTVVILDPPRKGCEDAALQAVASLSPAAVVMVSCNPATAARDIRTLSAMGFLPEKIQPVDLFARTKHVESVTLLRKANA